MKKQITYLLKKQQKGQILVMLGLLFIGLVAIVGLAIDLGLMFVAYSRLNRAVDAAALAATGEYKRNIVVADMKAAAMQMLRLNEVNTANVTSIDIDTCKTKPGDLELCPQALTDPARKLVRVTVSQRVPLYFLSVVGIRDVGITAKAISEAASLDVVLVVDHSTSMTENAPYLTTGRDPKICNEADPFGTSTTTPAYDGTYTGGPDGLPGECHPFEEVKWAATSFSGYLNYEYDRLGIVVTDRLAHVGETIGTVTFSGFPLIGNVQDDPGTINNEIQDASNEVIDGIKAMEVYEGSGLCPYDSSTKGSFPNDPNLEPCRMYDNDGVTFRQLDCPNTAQPPYDVSRCTTTNIGGGVALAGATLAGDYGDLAPYLPPNPKVRKEAVWVVIVLSDGNANAGYSPDAICPTYTWLRGPKCRDKDPYTRHDSSDINLYDPDDYARDMADIVAGNSVFIFSIGLGKKLNIRDDGTDAGGNCIPFTVDPDSSPMNCSPGQELLGYLAVGAAKEVGMSTFAGTYYNVGDNADQLERVFLDIYNKLTTKLTK